MSDNALVVKSNKLIEARYTLNLNEQKIILYAVGKLDRDQKEFNVLRFDVKEFTKLIGTTRERYSEIREIVRALRKREVIINTEEEELITGWLSSIKYIKNTGKIELEFSKNLIPYLLQLKKQFTRYELKNVLYFKNKYSIRIYELLKQFENIGKREFELENLKKIIGCENKHKDFRNFKRHVLEPAQQELSEYADISFGYENVTQGRKVVGLKFSIITKQDEEKMLINTLYSKEQIKEIKQKTGLEKENFNAKQIIELCEIAVLKAEDIDVDIHDYIRINYEEMIKKKTARNKFAWLKKALEGVVPAKLL